MAIRKITFNSANVTAQNDSDFYNFLVGKNGILKGVRENAKATNNSNKITFQAGYVAIYGRLILIEKDTNITIPLTQNAKGYVVVSVNLALNNVELTYKEGSTNYPNLTQENLISNSSGVYELAICAYSKTTTSLTLDSNFTPEYINQKANNFYGKNNTGKMLKVGSDGYLELIDENTLFVDKAKKDANGKVINEEYAKKVNLDDHASNVENPHNVTKKQVGLEFVDNTSDANKPISILQQAKFEEISKDYNKKISDLSDNIDLEMQGKADLGIDGKIPTDQMPTTGIIMDSAKKDGEGNIIDATYETKTDATSKLNKAKDHTTTEVSNLKKYTDEQFKKINDNLIATVDCSHKYEITGNTGDEHGLAIDDQQMLIKKIQGHSRRKSLNLLNFVDTSSLENSTYNGKIQNGVITINSNTANSGYKTVFIKYLEDFKKYLTENQQKIYIGFHSNINSNNNLRMYFHWTDKSGTQYQEQCYANNFNVISVNGIDFSKSTTYIAIDNNNSDISGMTNIIIKPIFSNVPYNELIPYQPYDNTLVNSNNQLISTGRNLNKEPFIQGKLNINTGLYESNHTHICSSDFSPYLIPNQEITVELSEGYGAETWFIEYDENQKMVSAGAWSIAVARTFTPSNKCKYFKLTVNSSNASTLALVYYGSKKDNIAFEPYKQDIIQAPSLGEFDYYQEGKIYRQTSQVITLNGSESWAVFDGVSNRPSGTYCYHIRFDNLKPGLNNAICNNFTKFNEAWEKGGVGTFSTNAFVPNIYFVTDKATIDDWKQYLSFNPIQLVYKLATPTIEEYALPSGYAVYNGGLQIQQGDVPYTITKQYNLSQKAQILANIEVDREQQKQIDEVNNKIINLPSPSITNRTVKNISINNTFPQTLTSEQTKDVFNNDLFVILSVGGSQNFYEYKNVIENPSEGKTFINISPGMKDYVSENVSFDILYVASNGYIRKESFQIDKFPVYQHSILITDEKDTRILCSIVAKKARTISKISELKYLINASGLKVVCNGFVKQTLTRQGGMAFELNTQSGDVKVKYVDLNNNSNSIYDVALNSISGLKILDTVYDYTEANG